MTAGKSEEQCRKSMILSVAVVYYFRLDSDSRHLFVEIISKLSTFNKLDSDFNCVLKEAMARIAE